MSELHKAAKKGDLEQIKALLAGRANVDSVTSNGWTPLQIAAENGHEEVVKTLLKGGANVNAVLPSGGTRNYTCLWNTGDTTQTITDLIAGDYIVTVTDEGGQIARSDLIFFLRGRATAPMCHEGGTRIREWHLWPPGPRPTAPPYAFCVFLFPFFDC